MDQDPIVVRFGKLVAKAVKIFMEGVSAFIKHFTQRLMEERKKRIVFYSSKYKKTPKARLRAQLRRIQRE